MTHIFVWTFEDLLFLAGVIAILIVIIIAFMVDLVERIRKRFKK
jgi:hypothetical protein